MGISKMRLSGSMQMAMEFPISRGSFEQILMARQMSYSRKKSLPGLIAMVMASSMLMKEILWSLVESIQVQTQLLAKLIADANATVVSPLTTIISNMMELGATKDEAIVALALALGLDTTIDFTHYDPIQKAFEGDSRATVVMMANLRMANLVNQAEGLLRVLSADYQGYDVGSNLLGEIARNIKTEGQDRLLDLEKALIDGIPIALASVGTQGELSIEDQLAMYQLMADLINQFLHMNTIWNLMF